MSLKINSEAEFVHSLSKALRKRSVSPDISGYKPHNKQVDFHKSTAKQRLYIGGNRAGKTVGGACEAIWWLTGKHPYRKVPSVVHGRIVASDFIQGVGKIVMPMIQRWLPPSELINGSWEDSYDKMSRTLTLASGNDVEFLSYDQALLKFAGTSRNFIWFDEEPPQDIFQECLMRTLDVEGSMWETLTPIDGMTWIYDSLYLPGLNPENKDIHVTEVLTIDNPYLPDNAVDAIKGFYDDAELEARLKGRFVQRAGLIYPEFTKENNIIPMLPDGPPKDHLWVAGLDHGLNNATAWLWASVDPEGNILIFDEYVVSNEVVSVHADNVHAINFEHNKVPDFYVGDPSIRNREPLQGSSVLEEYGSAGISIALGNNSLTAGYSRVRAYITGKRGPKLRVTDNCTTLIEQLTKLHWETYQNKRISNLNNAKEVQRKKDDHAPDALRYIVMSRPELIDISPDTTDRVLQKAMILVPHTTWDSDEPKKHLAGYMAPKNQAFYDEYTGEI